MIRFVSPDLESVMISYLDQLGEFHAKLYSQYQTYGAQSKIVDFWLLLNAQQTLCGVISRLEDRLTVVAQQNCDLKELAYFLCAAGKSVLGELGLLTQLNAIIHGELYSSWMVRVSKDRKDACALLPHKSALGADGIQIQVRPADQLRQVYTINAAADTAFTQMPYDSWLTEISHKVRHQLAQIYILYQADKPISTMGIYFQNTHTALLGGLATLPEWEKCGYGSRILQDTVDAAIRKNLCCGLFTANDQLLPFYQKNGFEPVGRWGVLHFP